MNIAAFCPNWVGDLVMATPALRAIRTHFPHATITAIMRPYVADVLAGLDLVDSIVLHQPFGGVPENRGWRFARQLRNHRFDVALLLPNSFRSAIWAWMSGAPRRVGMNRNGRGFLLTDRLEPKPRHQPHPVLDEYLRLAAHLGCRNLTRNMELATTADDEHQLRAFWRRQRARGAAVPPAVVSGQATVGLSTPAPKGHSPDPGQYICLNPGGAFGAAKHWPVSSFAELARRAANELGTTVLVLCGPAERDEAREIVRIAAHRAVITLADDFPTLGLTKAAIRHARLLVTTDSGPRHFAAPFQVPVVTMFGPTHVAWSETHYERSLNLQLDMDCGPCQKRVCPLKHHRCMRDLSVNWVMKAVVSLLEQYPSRKAA